MRIPTAEHEAHDWVIGRIAPDFELLDAWALPVRGGAEDFDAFLNTFARIDPADTGPVVVRILFAVRYRLGAWFGWDDAVERPIPGHVETTLAARLPDELRGSAAVSATDEDTREKTAGFVPLYRTAEEWASEISNGTVHGVLHLAWVQQDSGDFRAELGVYVKPRGRMGRLYLAAIAPFRHLIVYPALMRHAASTWETR